VQKVTGSLLDHGTIIGAVFQASGIGKVFSTEYAIYSKILNLFRISLYGEAINYRPYVSPSFEQLRLPAMLKTAISAIIIIITWGIDINV